MHSNCSKDIVHNCKRPATFHPELIDVSNFNIHNIEKRASVFEKFLEAQKKI